MSLLDCLALEISNLTPWEIFDVYDGPRFYSCKSKVGQIYLVYWVEEVEDSDQWLYIKVSQDRYYSLVKGRISIRACYEFPEEGFAYLVSVRGRNDFSIVPTFVEQFDSDWLPDENEYLELDSRSTLLPTKLLDVQQAAVAGSRQVLDLAFETHTNSYEMAAETLGKILTSTQNYLYASACPKDVDVRRIAESVKDANKMMVTGLFASSFGVRLQSNNGDLFGESSHSQNLEQFIDILSSLNKPSEMILRIKSVNLLARSRFRIMLKDLVSGGLSIKAEWSDPFGGFGSSYLGLESLKSSLCLLDGGGSPDTDTVSYNRVRLVGVDVENDFFAIVTDSGELLKGKLDRSLDSYQFSVPSIVNVTIEETCTINPVTDKERWSYILISVSEST